MALMTSYNQLKGVYTGCSRNLVTHILRCEWGYKDIVMNDWGTKYDPAAALHAQVHMTMPGCDAVLAGLTNGSIPSHIAFAKGQRKFLWDNRMARVNLRGVLQSLTHHTVWVIAVLLRGHTCVPFKDLGKIALGRIVQKACNIG